MRATIDGTPEIVTFVDEDDYASPQQMAKLMQANLLAQSVNTDLLYSNRAMLLNRKLLQKVRLRELRRTDIRGWTRSRARTSADRPSRSSRVANSS